MSQDLTLFDELQKRIRADYPDAGKLGLFVRLWLRFFGQFAEVSLIRSLQHKDGTRAVAHQTAVIVHYRRRPYFWKFGRLREKDH